MLVMCGIGKLSGLLLVLEWKWIMLLLGSIVKQKLTLLVMCSMVKLKWILLLGTSMS
jgi:hypothetical protein